MKDPFHAPAPEKGTNGGRIGIGVGVTLALLIVRLCLVGSRSSSYSPTYDPYIYTPPSLPTATLPRLPPKHTMLLTLEGPDLESKTEDIELANVGESEEPGPIWAAPDGTVFVATKTDQNRSHVHRRSTTGTWDVIARRRTARVAQLWGRTAEDLYIMDHDSLAHFDGIRTHEIEPPTKQVFALGGIGDDVFIAALPPSGDDDAPAAPMQVHRRHGKDDKWTPEKIADGLAVQELWSGGGQLFARALPKDGDEGTDDRLLQRTANGKWTERNWFGAKRPATTSIQAVWVNPTTSDAFVATDAGIYRSANGGASWSKSGPQTDVEAIWGRSNTDVYATSRSGLLHYDGKTWTTTTAFTRRAAGITGTKTQVFLSVLGY